MYKQEKSTDHNIINTSQTEMTVDDGRTKDTPYLECPCSNEMVKRQSECFSKRTY